MGVGEGGEIILIIRFSYFLGRRKKGITIFWKWGLLLDPIKKSMNILEDRGKWFNQKKMIQNVIKYNLQIK